MSKFILVAETGADIPVELAEKYQIRIVPMHVCFGDLALDDGSFPVEDVFAYYDKNGVLPTTSGSTPNDFEVVYDKIHAEHPDKHIVYLAYSAVTTCSYQSAIIASEGRDYITSIDTKCCSCGQALLVITMAQYLEANPDATLEEVVAKAENLISRARMAFFPGDLVYLKAGGRVSNAAYLGAKLLNLNPMIEITDGRLYSKEKYRGSKMLAFSKMMPEYTKKHNINKEAIALLWSGTLDEKLKAKVEETAINLGYLNFIWMRTGCVVSVHSGPGAIGFCGFAD